jgi:hypothetical protein
MRQVSALAVLLVATTIGCGASRPAHPAQQPETAKTITVRPHHEHPENLGLSVTKLCQHTPPGSECDVMIPKRGTKRTLTQAELQRLIKQIHVHCPCDVEWTTTGPRLISQAHP